MKTDLNTSINTDASESSLTSSINTMLFTELEFKAHFQTSQLIYFTYICYLYYLEKINEEWKQCNKTMSSAVVINITT